MSLPSWPVAWQQLFAPLLDKWASYYGLPRDLVYGLVAQESSFNSGAYRAEPQIGDASYGLTQVLYRTAEGEGYTGTVMGLFDPDINLRLGLGYLSKMVARFGRTGGVAAYNGGLIGGTIHNQPYVDGVEAKASYFRGLWSQPSPSVTPPSEGYGYSEGTVGVAESASIPAWLVLGLLAAALVVRRQAP